MTPLQPLYDKISNPKWPGMISCPPGWNTIVLELDRQLAEIDPDYKIDQVKAKFGGLRYYCTNSENYKPAPYPNDIWWELILAAESLSYKTCEDCGATGELRSGSWAIVLCDYCAEERDGNCRIKPQPKGI